MAWEIDESKGYFRKRPSFFVMARNLSSKHAKAREWHWVYTHYLQRIGVAVSPPVQERPPKKQKHCAYCGEIFMAGSARKYCSIKCAGAENGKRRSVAAQEERKNTCTHCGKEYVAKKKDRNKFCSRECFMEHRSAHAKPKVSAVYFGKCCVCGGAYVRNRPHKHHVCKSVECEKQHERNRARVFSEAKAVKKSPRRCKFCGESFVPKYADKKRVFCSSKCLKKHATKERNKKYGKNHRSRARYYGCEYEPVNAMLVFERDGWVCRICGKATPEIRKGTRYSNAPELDHVVPLSKGGAHAYFNVQCSCRACNREKAAELVPHQVSMVDMWFAYP